MHGFPRGSQGWGGSSKPAWKKKPNRIALRHRAKATPEENAVTRARIRPRRDRRSNAATASPNSAPTTNSTAMIIHACPLEMNMPWLRVKFICLDIHTQKKAGTASEANSAVWSYHPPPVNYQLSNSTLTPAIEARRSTSLGKLSVTKARLSDAISSPKRRHFAWILGAR